MLQEVLEHLMLLNMVLELILRLWGEPTKLFPVIAHKGCDYFEETFHGKSVHSSVPENGSNAIFAVADFIERIENTLIPEYNAKHHDLVGSPTINAGLIQRGAHSNNPFLLGGHQTILATIHYVRHVN